MSIIRKNEIKRLKAKHTKLSKEMFRYAGSSTPTIDSLILSGMVKAVEEEIEHFSEKK